MRAALAVSMPPTFQTLALSQSPEAPSLPLCPASGWGQGCKSGLTLAPTVVGPSKDHHGGFLETPEPRQEALGTQHLMT